MSWFLSHPDPAAVPEVKDADAGQPTDNEEDEVTSSNDDTPQTEVCGTSLKKHPIQTYSDRSNLISVHILFFTVNITDLLNTF